MRSLRAFSAVLVVLSGCRSPEPRAAVPEAEPHAPASDAPGQEGDDLGWSSATSEQSAPLSASSGDTPAKRLVAEAVRQLRAMRSTQYRHKTKVDESSGTFEYDCSGFVSYALWNAAPDALAAVPIGPKGRARAEDFTAFFASLPAPASGAWERVPRASALREGDVVAWLRPDDVDNGNTGHIVIVLDPPRRVPPSAAVSAIGGSEELLLRVVDSTESAHADDVRGKSTTTGLGTGTIGVVVDASGAPIGYRWKGGVSAKAHATKVAIGRLVATETNAKPQATTGSGQ